MINTQLLLIALWMPQALWQVLLWAHWWQVKEYRFDRFKVLLRQKSGRRKLYVTYIFIKLLFLLISPTVTIPILVLLFGDSLALLHAIRRKLRRPVITQRVKRILAVTVIGITILLTLGLLEIYRFEASLLFAELFLLLGPILGILWTAPIVNQVLEKEVSKAENKLKKLDLTVIGITGSYGKSTTKEFLSHILKSTYKTEKTNKNQNNTFGVARKVLNDFDTSAEMFVAEMGAYKKGEIKAITEFTHPQIAILTGLEPQHLELFGSFDKILDAKFELTDSLPDGGMALFNVTNKDCERLAKRAEKKKKNINVLRYKLVQKLSSRSSIDAQSKIVTIKSDSIVFDIKIGKDKKRLTAPVTGGHFVENLTGAILLARKLKVPWRKIQKQLQTLQVPGHTMHTYVLNDGTTVVDDTNNSTPRGFTAALNYLETYKDKTKVVIASGIIELGTYSHVIHQDIAKLAGDMTDVVVLTNYDYYEDFAKNLNANNQLIVIEEPTKLISFFTSLENSTSVVLLEGKLPSVFTEYIEKEKQK